MWFVLLERGSVSYYSRAADDETAENNQMETLSCRRELDSRDFRENGAWILNLFFLIVFIYLNFKAFGNNERLHYSCLSNRVR